MSEHAYTSLRIEGGLLPAHVLDDIYRAQLSHQKPQDYGLPANMGHASTCAYQWTLMRGFWDAFELAPDDPSHTLTWLEQLLRMGLGFTDLRARTDVYREEDREFFISHEARGGSVPLLLVPASHDLDTPHEAYRLGNRKVSPTVLLQTLLNARKQCLWGIVSNGVTLRLLRDNPSFSRQSWVEVDLGGMLRGNRAADFQLMWLMLHGSRFDAPSGKPVGEQPGTAIMELWLREARRVGERALQELQQGVITALTTLGKGFMDPRNEALLSDLDSGRLSLTDFHRQLLRLVYRLLFLYCAEERDLLHAPDTDAETRHRYAEGYGVGRLRRRAGKAPGRDPYGDLWQSLTLVFSCLREGEPLLGLPALGGLFEADQCPHLEGARLGNESLLRAVRGLVFFRRKGLLTRVNFRDMGTEELGGIYECLLELLPRYEPASRYFYYAGHDENRAEQGSGTERKLTGSYYTPPELVEHLVARTLDPLIEETVAAHGAEADRALLRLKIVDPACGSGHFLLAAARRLAGRVASLRAGGLQPEPAVYREALREVVRGCIHGVDLNPLAVELCRTALWLESVTPGKPFQFLEHHIRLGNALLGLIDDSLLQENHIPAEAYKVLDGDDKETVNQLKKDNTLKGQASLFAGQSLIIAPTSPGLDDLPEDDLAAVRAKRERWYAHRRNEATRNAFLAADLYTAAFLAYKTPENRTRVPTSVHLDELAAGTLPDEGVVDQARELARQHHFFHWYLEFPEVFQGGGFDLVLGNPPWERFQFEEKQFFAGRAPQIEAASKASDRKAKIAALASGSEADRTLLRNYKEAKRVVDGTASFVRLGGRFPLTARGELNLYPLFAETALRLADRGRVGIIVPTGICTDDSTKLYFAHLMATKRLASLYDIENRKGIFPGIDNRIKFCLLTLAQDVPEAQFLFFAHGMTDLDDPRRCFPLSQQDIERFNPNTLTCPIFRGSRDAALTRKLYKAGEVLIREVGNSTTSPWNLYLRRFLNMADDSHLFITRKELEQRGAKPCPGGWTDDISEWVPLYEGKMVHLYDNRWATAEKGKFRDCTDEEKHSSSFDVSPRYWVPIQCLEKFKEDRGWAYDWFIGWRDVARSTDERTAIIAPFPAGGVNDKLPLIFPGTEPIITVCLLANMSSLIFDYVSRQKVGGTSFSYFILKQLPVIPPEVFADDRLRDYICQRVLQLVFTNEAMRPFARDLGYEGDPYPWNEARRLRQRAELDAVFARLYGLDREDLRYLLDPADVEGPDYPSVTFPGLRRKEEKKYGSYRTRDLILEAYDRNELSL